MVKILRTSFLDGPLFELIIMQLIYFGEGMGYALVSNYEKL